MRPNPHLSLILMSNVVLTASQTTIDSQRSAAPARKLRELVLVSCALAGFVLVLYRELLFTNRVLASGDILLYFYPYRDYAAAMLRSGQIPLWNPYIFLGVPFLANPQAAVLYPLHWPLIGLSVTQQIYWSAALHTWLLGLGGYALLRRWHISPWGALTGGLILAGSGFYGGLLGHINQMNGAAWLPWAALTLVPISVPQGFGALPGRSLPWRTALMAFCVAMMLLAGHTQTAYINLFGLGAWIALTAGLLWLDRGWRAALERGAGQLLVLGGGALLGAWICAAQLLPTLELSDLGLRSGGLSYWDVTSFSLRPLKLPWTLLPSYGLVDLGVVFEAEGYTEFVAYVGVIGLGLAAWGAWRGRGPVRWSGLILAAGGLFLAAGRWNPAYYVLYQLVPGFDLFRVPARWLMLYTLGVALLAGTGVDQLRLQFLSKRRIVTRVAGTIVVLLAVELWLAAAALPHTHTTAPQAVYDVRTAPAHLLTDPVRTALSPAAMGRFLSMSNTTFDPGDMADYRRIYREGASAPLDERAFRQLLVALKAQEILAPNLPLLWRIPAVDGFDGGVLPLQRYIRALTLFVPPERLVPDGRLREQVAEVPSTGLLGLLNAQYVITDKVRDVWFQDVYYDRQIGAALGPEPDATVEIDVPEPFPATRLDLLGYVTGEPSTIAALENVAQPVAAVHVVWDVDAPAQTVTFALRAGGAAGAQFADGALDSSLAAASGATVAYRDVEGQGQEYVAQFALDKPDGPQSIRVERLDGALAERAADDLTVVIRAATLVDERTGTFVPLLPSDRGQFRLVHGGDVKVYENRELVPRAHLVHTVRSAADAEDALTQVREHAHALRDTAIVEGLEEFSTLAHEDDRAEIVAYGAERVEIRTRSEQPAFLVLSDSYYPGWQVQIDGAAADIYPTNALLRGVPVPAGEHTVVFEYRPSSWQRGVRWSGVGLAIWLITLVGGGIWVHQRR